MEVEWPFCHPPPTPSRKNWGQLFQGTGEGEVKHEKCEFDMGKGRTCQWGTDEFEISRFLHTD